MCRKWLKEEERLSIILRIKAEVNENVQIRNSLGNGSHLAL
jgi:hypothetical protein